MSRELKTFCTFLSLLIVVGTFCLLFGCEVEKKNQANYLYKVTLTMPDGKVREWMAGPDAHIDDGFFVWKHKNGGKVSVSGCLAIEPVLIPAPEPEPKEKE